MLLAWCCERMEGDPRVRLMGATPVVRLQDPFTWVAPTQCPKNLHVRTYSTYHLWRVLYVVHVRLIVYIYMAYLLIKI